MPYIPFNRPFICGSEFAYIRDAINAWHLSGDGTFSKRCERLLEGALRAERVLLTTSCTHALELSALLLDVGAGDEVIVPSFTFVTTANAFLLRGARPVFADIRPDTFCIDVEHVKGLVGPRTKAIVPVHYAGVAADMDELLDVAEAANATVVEDNAHGLFGTYRNRLLGSFGAMSTLSFHETKNFTCGEGGALVLNDEAYVERAEIMREKGTNRSAFFRGQVDKYTWVDLGSSYVPSDILAAYLYAQLECRADIQKRRRWIWHRYYDSLADWADSAHVRLPVVPESAEQSYHMFPLLLDSLERRQALIQHLKLMDVNAVFHYVPLHLTPMGRQLGGKVGDCPVSERVSDCLLRLPFFSALTDEEITQVVDALHCFEG